jgi:hypothetical protein
MNRKGLLIIGVLVVLIVVGVWGSRDTFATARVGTVYVAKQTCSCLFVAGRPLDSCYTDFDAEAVRPLDVSVSPDSVTVSALGGLISARARYDEGYGCHPVS